MRAVGDELGLSTGAAVGVRAGARAARPVSACGWDVRWRWGRELLLAEHPTARLERRTRCRRSRALVAAVVARRRMAAVYLTADQAFAKRCREGSVMLRPATGELARRAAGGGGSDRVRSLAFEQADVARARALGGVFRLEVHALAFAKQLEHRVAHGTAVEEMSVPPSSRMNPNPLSMRRRAIVPVAIALPSTRECLRRMAERIPGASRPPERTQGHETNREPPACRPKMWRQCRNSPRFKSRERSRT